MEEKPTYVQFNVQGAVTDEEEEWAREIAMKAHNDYCNLIRPIVFVYRLYKKVWDLRYQKSKDIYEELPNYMNSYIRIANFVANRAVGFHGGHKKHKTIRLNTDWEMHLVDEENNIWESDNFIFIDRR